MIYCAKCGTQFEGRYCPSCGAPAAVGATQGTTQGAGASAGANASDFPPPSDQQPYAPGLASNWASVICYVVQILGPIVFLFVAPYNRDRKIRFDAWQALFLQIAYFALLLVIGAVTAFSWRLTLFLDRLVDLGYFALVVILAIKAYQSKTVVLPYIGPFAQKQK